LWIRKSANTQLRAYLIWREAVDGNALQTRACARDDADRTAGKSKDVGQKRDERRVGGIVDRRRRDTDEDRVVADAVDGGVLRPRDDADVDLGAVGRRPNQPRTCVQT
jgi:hypothetical protein